MTRVHEEVEKLGSTDTAGEMQNGVATWETVCKFLQTELSYNPAVPYT
jgi:hypothetical protein